MSRKKKIKCKEEMRSDNGEVREVKVRWSESGEVRVKIEELEE